MENDSITLDLSALPFSEWPTTEAPSEATNTVITLDSILPPRELPDTIYRQSIFHRHTLQVQHQELQPRPEHHTAAWVFAMLILLSALLCIYYHLRKIKIKTLLHATIDRRALDRLIRDSNLNRTSVMLPMGMFICATLAMAVHLQAMRETGVGGYLLLSAGLMAAYILRNGLLRLLGNTFENKAAVDIYISSNYIFHLTEATLVCVLLYPLAYLPGGGNAMLVTIAVVLGIGLLMRFLRGMKLFLTLSSGPSFYLFYYLCTVEIVPALVLIKLVITQ